MAWYWTHLSGCIQQPAASTRLSPYCIIHPRLGYGKDTDGTQPAENSRAAVADTELAALYTLLKQSDVSDSFDVLSTAASRIVASAANT